MKSKKLLKLIALLLVGCNLCGCLNLDVTPCTVDAAAYAAYCIPTNPKKPEVDLDLKKNLSGLNKYTCFSADDMAEIERHLKK